MTAPTDLSDDQLLKLLSGSGSPVNADPSLPRTPIEEHALAPIGSRDDQWLLAALANTDPKMSTGEDMARSGVSGVEQGAAGVGGIAGDLTNLYGSGFAHAGKFVGDTFGIKSLSDAGQWSLDNPTDFGTLNHLATSDRLNHNIQAVAGPYHEPQTTEGKFARTIGQFAPAGLMGGGGIPARVAQVVVPGMASEAAGEAAHSAGPGWETAARIAGGVAGGLGVGGAQAALRAPDAAIGAAIPNLTEAQMQAVQTLRQSASARGLTLSLPEAVQQVTNNATGLGRMQRVIEGTREGQSRTAPYFSDRPDRVRNAVNQFADTIHPPTDQPGMIGVDAQRAAQLVEQGANQARTEAVRPYYREAGSMTVDPAHVESILQGLDAQIAADRTGLLAPRLTQFRDDLIAQQARPGAPAVAPQRVQNGASFRMEGGSSEVPAQPRVPITDIENLDRARKYWREQIDAPPTALDPLSKEQGASIGSRLQELDALMERSSRPFQQGKEAYADASRAIVDPIMSGPVGAISRTADVGAQTEALYPRNPAEGAPAETAQAAQLMNGAPALGSAPDLANALTRQHVMTSLNQASRDLAGGQNQYAGSKLANMIAGNAEQEATLHAGVGALPGGAARSADLADLLEALRATGKRQPAGSMTAFNEADLKDMGVSPTVRNLQHFDIARPFEFIGEGLKSMNYRRNLNALADMIMSNPDETAEILRRARAAAPGGGANGALVVAPVAAGQRP